MGLTAQNGYSLSKDCQLVRNNSRPEYFRCPIHPSEDPAVPFSKSWILLSLRALFFSQKKKKKKATPLPVYSPAYSSTRNHVPPR